MWSMDRSGMIMGGAGMDLEWIITGAGMDL
jgi:hypothetical protein